MDEVSDVQQPGSNSYKTLIALFVGIDDSFIFSLPVSFVAKGGITNEKENHHHHPCHSDDGGRNN